MPYYLQYIDNQFQRRYDANGNGILTHEEAREICFCLLSIDFLKRPQVDDEVDGPEVDGPEGDGPEVHGADSRPISEASNGGNSGGGDLIPISPVNPPVNPPKPPVVDPGIYDEEKHTIKGLLAEIGWLSS